MEKGFIRIQLQHEHAPHEPYTPKELEDALQKLDLPEFPSNSIDQEGIIRRETGPEIAILAKSLASHAPAIISLASAWKRNRPETKVQITIDSPYELKLILDVLKSEYSQDT